MCGFLVSFSKTGFTEKAHSKFRAALRAQASRGPDSCCLLTLDKILLGHNRLAVNDLTDFSAQPFSKIPSQQLLYNGEIYNTSYLLSKYQSLLSVKQPNSDTEILYELLQLLPIDQLLNELEGMFSFVYIDTNRSIAIAARDKFGQKPLFYKLNHALLTLSSSIPSIIGTENLPCSVSSQAVSTYLATTSVIDHLSTFFSNINVIEAGSYAVINIDALTIDTFQYFTPCDLITSTEPRQRSLPDALDELDQLLRNTIPDYISCDANYGVLLSGGIDSSLLYRYTLQSDANIRSYSKTIPSIENIPDQYITKILKSSNVHTVIRPVLSSYLKNLINYISFGGRPAPWGGGPPLMDICARARKDNTKVLISGDGVDEYASGYVQTTNHLLNHCNSLGHLDHLCMVDKPSVPTSYIQYQNDLRLNILDKLSLTTPSLHSRWLVNSLHNIQFFLQACNLPHSDTLSMINSVELRNPFLDTRVVQYFLNLPVQLLLQKWASTDQVTGKYLLKSLAYQSYASSFDDSYFLNKEGTRNLSREFSRLEFWNWSAFSSIQLFDLALEPLLHSWRSRFSLINIELFSQIFICRARPCQDFCLPLLSDDGKSKLIDEF